MVTPLLTLIEMHSAQPPKHPRRDEREEWEMDGPLKGRGSAGGWAAALCRDNGHVIA